MTGNGAIGADGVVFGLVQDQPDVYIASGSRPNSQPPGVYLQVVIDIFTGQSSYIHIQTTVQGRHASNPATGIESKLSLNGNVVGGRVCRDSGIRNQGQIQIRPILVIDQVNHAIDGHRRGTDITGTRIITKTYGANFVVCNISNGCQRGICNAVVCIAQADLEGTVCSGEDVDHPLPGIDVPEPTGCIKLIGLDLYITICCRGVSANLSSS